MGSLRPMPVIFWKTTMLDILICNFDKLPGVEGRMIHLVKVSNITSIAASFVIRVLDILAHVLPREESLEARYFGSVMADLEDQIDNGNRSGTTTIG